MSNIVHYYKEMGQSMELMLAGYSKRGPQFNYIDSEGTRILEKKFFVRSGAVCAYGDLGSG